MKFVVSLAFSPPSHLCALARAADEAGFDSAAIADHVVHPRTILTPYPYTDDGQTRWEPFTPWPDPWVTIGALAAASTRLRFLTTVFVLPMRNPFLVAKAVGTAAVLSNNRVALGIGAGWMKDEFDLCGQTFAARGKRMDEMIELMRRLWAGGWVEYHGKFYDCPPLEMSPAPSEPIPIYAGGLSEPALRRAATRCEGWISDLHTIEQLRELVARLRSYRNDSPRAGQPFAVFAATMDAYDLDGYRRLEETGVTHNITMPWVFYGGALDNLEQKLDSIRRFGDEVIARMR